MIPIIGSVCLGAFFGFLIGSILNRTKEVNAKLVSSLLGFMSAGGVIEYFASGDPLFWWYPIGLVCGKAIHSVLSYLLGADVKQAILGSIRFKRGHSDDEDKDV